MSLLSRSLNVEQTKAAIPIAQPGRQFPAVQVVNGRIVSIRDNPDSYIRKGYDINDMVYSIINLIVRKCKVAPWGMYRIVDEQAYKKLQSIYRQKTWSANDYAAASMLQRKALKPVAEPGKWGELLKYPNEEEVFNDFIGNGIAYKLLLGNKYILGKPLKGGANAGIPFELRNMPSQHINIWATNTFPSRVIKYNIGLIPTVFYIPGEVLHEKYWNPNYNINGEQLYGVAPLKAALGLLGRNNSSMTASASAFDNGGIKGVLHLKAVPGQVDGELLVQEVSNLKDAVVGEWSGADNYGRMGVGGYDMGWIPIGLTHEEMQLIESEKWDLRRFCSVWNVNSQLLNDDQKAYNNFEEAQKALTTGAALPELCSTRDQLNRKGSTVWGFAKGNVVDFDLSVYSELQADVKDTATWTSQLLAISPNEQRELCGLAALPDEQMNEPFILTTNRQALSDYQMNAVDAALNMDQS